MTYFAQLMAGHKCDDCSGSGPVPDRLREEIDPFCPNCGYLMELHEQASECPDETEARERWGE